MAIQTNEANQQANDEYAAGFNDDTARAAEPSEDDAFGLNLDAAPGAAAEEAKQGGEGEGEGTPAALVVVDGEGLKDAAEGAQADASAEEAAESQSQESQGDGAGDGEGKAMTEQQLRSWQGRLKKLEAELKAKAAEPGGAETTEEVAVEVLEETADQAEAKGDDEMAEQVEQAADQVESGEMTVEAAMSMLADDFGEPFVKMIELIARGFAEKMANEKLGGVQAQTQDIIDHITSEKARAHFDAIFAAHPDFNEIAKDPAFAEWKEADPERARIADSGSASEINQLLSDWKSQGAGTDAGSAGDADTQSAAAGDAPEQSAADADTGASDDAASDDELDAAEGISSGGMKLPEEPAASDDYAGAWNEFTDADRKKG